MKKNCQQCNKEFEAQRRTSKYCGDACRQAHQRSVTKLSVTEPKIDSVTKDIEDMTALKEMHVALEDVCTPEEIKYYPNMCETKRLEKEAIYRLENNSIEDLEKKKISIPNWRRVGEKYPNLTNGLD